VDDPHLAHEGLVVEHNGLEIVRRVVPAVRAVFLIGSVLVAVAGFQLSVLTDHTERLFAWTIDSGLSATFIGGFYVLALAVAVRSVRHTAWSHARIGVYGVAAFVTLTLVATLAHLEVFHLTEGPASARIAAWAWLAVYVIAPPGVIAALVVQHRAPGGDAPRDEPMPSWYRALLAAQAALMLGAGAWLFVDPASATWWPWPLTPLAGRAMAAWLIGMGIVHVTAVLDRDMARIRAAAPAYALLGVLLLIALVRYPDELRGGTSEILYLVVLAVAIVTGVVGAIPRRRHA
jgi:hypothetical protein